MRLNIPIMTLSYISYIRPDEMIFRRSVRLKQAKHRTFHETNQTWWAKFDVWFRRKLAKTTTIKALSARIRIFLKKAPFFRYSGPSTSKQVDSVYRAPKTLVFKSCPQSGAPRGGGGYLGNFCWLCAAGLSEPQRHYSQEQIMLLL